MENSSKFLIDHYYKELEAVERSLQSNSKTHLKADRPKTFLKSKGQLSIRKVREDDKKMKKYQIKQNRLSLDMFKSPSLQIQAKMQTSEIPLKYLENIDESIIDRNILDNSGITKSENNKIVLEIHGLQLQDQDKQTIKYCKSPNKNKLQQKKQFKNLNLHSDQLDNNKKEIFIFNSETATQKLLQNLQQRDKIYRIVNKKCNKSGDIGKQFEQMWRKYQLYEKLIQKLSNTWNKN